MTRSLVSSAGYTEPLALRYDWLGDVDPTTLQRLIRIEEQLPGVRVMCSAGHGRGFPRRLRKVLHGAAQGYRARQDYDHIEARVPLNAVGEWETIAGRTWQSRDYVGIRGTLYTKGSDADGSDDGPGLDDFRPWDIESVKGTGDLGGEYGDIGEELIAWGYEAGLLRGEYGAEG